jgi:basic amino acid/polyamine antiporter, APA family
MGAGIFVLTGTASAQYAGPAIVLSFVFAGLGCLAVGLCYAEFASVIPDAGSAYSYSYAAFGRFIGWLIGWGLILEYLFGASAVAVSWSGYFAAFLTQFGLNLPTSLTQAPFVAEWGWHIRRVPGAVVNLPSMVLVLALTALLLAGIRQSTRVNNLIVVAKVWIVLIIIGLGFAFVRSENWHPFVPPNSGTFGRYGWSGVLQGAAIVFYAYIGFDVISTAAQEARDPRRDVPRAIIASLAICSALYILMAAVITGMSPYPTLNSAHPVIAAVAGTRVAVWLRQLISIASIAGLASVTLVLLLGQARIVFAMSRDGLLPPALANVHPRFQTPFLPTIFAGVIAATLAGLSPMSLLGDLAIVGALLAFIAVCAAVLVLRYRRPNIRRAFRAPWVPFVPVLGIIWCAGVATNLHRDTWIRLAIWMAVGLAIYLAYGMRHARVSRDELLSYE